MNSMTPEISDLAAGDALTLESALAACGWQRHESASHRLPAEHGDAWLQEVGRSDRWRQFQLRGGAVRQSSNERALWDNDRLFGPAKWIAKPGSRPICRLDVPDDLHGSALKPLEFGFGALDPRVAWARAVTSLATGNIDEIAAAAPPNEATVEEINWAGWPASIDDGQLHVNVQTRGAYRQLEIERDPTAGVKLVTDLIDLNGLAEPCVEAILLSAQAAGARLPLVRLAIGQRGQRGALRAEVSFGAAPVGGAWLLVALCVLETAVATCAREVESLRDLDLARLLLAARAAGNS